MSSVASPAPTVSAGPAPAPVQRADDVSTSPPPPAPTPESGATAESTSLSGGVVIHDEPTPRQPTDAEVEQLARALYPQLRRRLGRDLLLDRERLGYRTDIRF